MFPEMKLPIGELVPPTVVPVDASSIRMPSCVLASAAVAPLFMPTTLFAITVFVDPLTTMPGPALPEMTLPNPKPATPTAVPVSPCTLTPNEPLAMATVPAAFVPTVLARTVLLAPDSSEIPPEVLPETRALEMRLPEPSSSLTPTLFATAAFPAAFRPTMS